MWTAFQNVWIWLCPWEQSLKQRCEFSSLSPVLALCAGSEYAGFEKEEGWKARQQKDGNVAQDCGCSGWDQAEHLLYSMLCCYVRKWRVLRKILYPFSCLHAFTVRVPAVRGCSVTLQAFMYMCTLTSFPPPSSSIKNMSTGNTLCFSAPYGNTCICEHLTLAPHLSYTDTVFVIKLHSLRLR